MNELPALTDIYYESEKGTIYLGRTYPCKYKDDLMIQMLNCEELQKVIDNKNIPLFYLGDKTKVYLGRIVFDRYVDNLKSEMTRYLEQISKAND